MAAEFDREQAYEEFVTTSRAAAAGGHYEVAYHVLMAALHCAEGADDTVRLADVARLFREHLRAIDAVSPAHRLSSDTARAHGHRSVFEMGAVTAEAARKRVESQQRLAEHRRDHAGRGG